VRRFSTFLAPPQEGLQRWQRWMLFVTGLIGAVTVEVWFYQSKGATCCRELRELLGCDGGDLAAPCRGFAGDCADLQAQFVELPSEVLPDGADVAGYECHAFPDDDRRIDQLWVGLIFAAVAIPLRYILSACACSSIYSACPCCAASDARHSLHLVPHPACCCTCSAHAGRQQRS
jgi:hypothetical protein